VNECNFPPAAQYPNDIENYGKATGTVTSRHLVAKGHQGENAELEELDAERYSDDGDAHQQSRYEIHDSGDETTENKPNNIAEQVHTTSL